MDRRQAMCAGFAALCAPPSAAWANRAAAAERQGGARIAPAFAAAGARLGAALLIEITKRPAILTLFAANPQGGYVAVRSWPVCAMSGALGPKQREGDGQAPEGLYRVRPGQMNAASQFHLSFNLGFPNAYERAQGWTGSFLMVHGGCASIGCYAMTDAGIEEIWAAMRAAFAGGQTAIPVHCFPFALTPEALDAAHAHPWAPFWRTLEPAYRLFRETRRPPRVSVVGGQYRVLAG